MTITHDMEQAMTKHTYKTAKRRYHRVFWPLMALYVTIVLSGSFYLESSESESIFLKSLLGIAMAVPLVGTLAVMVRFFEEADEYTRLLQFRAFAYGTVITLGSLAVFGGLQMFDAVGAIEVFWFIPGFFFAYGLSYRFLGGKECG